MLIGRMSDLARWDASQRGQDHAVVVNQLKGQAGLRAAGNEDYVAMLQIAVGHLRLAELANHAPPKIAKPLQNRRLVEVLPDKLIEKLAFHPAHLQDRIPIPVNANAVRLVLEVHRERQRRLFEMLAYLLIAFLQPLNFACKALDRPAIARFQTSQLVNIREVARTRHRQT